MIEDQVCEDALCLRVGRASLGVSLCSRDLIPKDEPEQLWQHADEWDRTGDCESEGSPGKGVIAGERAGQPCPFDSHR